MNSNPGPRPMRWWMPAIVIILATGAALVVRARELPFLEPLLILIGLAALLLLAVWYVFFTGLPWKRRLLLLLIGAGSLGGLFLGLKLLTRTEGSIGGSGIPRLVWKWAPKQQGPATPLRLAGGTSSAPAPTPGKAAEQGGGFPQFLGPERSGVLTGITLARDWSSTPPKQVWRQPVGLGWSSFSVSGNRAITQEQRGAEELVVCYDLGTGQALWAHTNHVHFAEGMGGDGPRATPTIHQGRVYTVGATGILDCLEEATGALVWSRDVLGENHLSNLTWGKSCSPLIVEGFVIVTGGNEREKALLAYDASTGKPAWQSGRDRASYCSPQLASVCGQRQILIVNGHSVTSHDIQSGNVLWEYAWPSDFAKATQPLVVDTNQVFLAAGYGVGCVLLRIDHPEAGKWSAVELWKNRNLKPKFTNLVRRGQYVYGLDDGVLTCLDLEKGDRKWKEGRYGHGQILLVEELLLIQAESGDVVLVEANPAKLVEAARLPALQGKTWNNPALVGDLLLVRNDQAAACYRLPVSSPGAATAQPKP